ncbi:UxaA family hydrolase [Propionivibrio dicarboxylicus]|uniref:Altronate hydrolase n=1 Tax=Propionivibrio dicarboxylicus TaxID=83767 RepID=A0A1G7WKP4_9RHOO|nr:UxaA family hydrolase [Propionivibrio dicarboxylicus]SDG72428.1 altronate hydrolase [Propionivibrio dicarboxylicus]
MQGYVRQDGKLGIRNTVQVVFLVECAHHVAKRIAESFTADVQYFGFPGCYPSDYGHRLVRNLCTHANVGAVLLVSLGCENFDRNRLHQEIRQSGRPCETLVIQETGGTAPSIAEGCRRVREMLATIAATPRRAMTFGDLIIGTVCGGSDGTSGITGNPAVGRAFDRLLADNAICMFEESGELIGCEPHMMARAADESVRRDIDAAMSKARDYYSTMGLGSFSNGNAVGGLTTLEEKSLGAYAKSGDGKISGVIRPTEIPTKPGLYLMDVVPDGEPRFGYPNICDTSEIVELIATGCHIVLFTTGRGSVIGSVIAPVIKVCNNPQTYARLSDDMDINAGRIISEGATLDDVADDILRAIENTASGMPTKAEKLGHVEFVLTYKDFDYGKACCR